MLPRDDLLTVQESENCTQMALTRAVSQIRVFPCSSLYKAHERMSCIVLCKALKNVSLRKRNYLLINCLIRLQSPGRLSLWEKGELVYAVSRRIFWVAPSIELECREWLEKNKKQEFQFLTTGLVLHDKLALKAALRTISYEISAACPPLDIPFTGSSLPFMHYCPSMMLCSIYVKTVNRSSIVSQPVLLLSMLETMCPPMYWPVVKQGLCYMPGFRETHIGENEIWSVHIHGDYDTEPVVSKPGVSQPLRLFNIAQMACIRMLFCARRASCSWDRKSPFHLAHWHRASRAIGSSGATLPCGSDGVC
nr:hypothetical protein [Tawny frogmouth aviadenovirus A]